MKNCGWCGWAIVLVLGGACGGSTSDDGLAGSAATPAQACTDLSAAYCNAIQKCDPFAIEYAYGTVATCQDRIAVGCNASMAAPGQSSTPAKLEACSQDVGGFSCEDLLNRKSPASCQPTAGTQVNGGACVDNSQCQSTFCNKSASSCGVCSAVPSAGSACTTDDDCAPGMKCANSNTCAVPGASGASCNDQSAPCAYPLACNGGTCGARAGSGAPGQACQSTGDCDASTGTLCIRGTCAAITLADPGGTCSVTATPPSVCKMSGTCSGQVCAAHAEDGAACNALTGPKCLAPAQCVQGLCRLPDGTCH